MKISLFFICVLAVWRVSNMFVEEIGPMHLFSNIRLFFGKRGQTSKIASSIYDGITCLACNSVWFSALASLVLAESVVQWIVYTLAISTAAILYEALYTLILKVTGFLAASTKSKG